MNRRNHQAVLSVVVLLLFPAAQTLADNPTEERRDRLESMSPAEKQELQRKWRRFESLPAAEQDRLRRLHAEVSAEENEHLQAVMRRYHCWLRSLSSGERAEVLSLPPAKRIERIEEMLQEQEEERFSRLVQQSITLDDKRVVHDWFYALVAEREEELIEALPHYWEDRVREIDSPERRRRALVGYLHRADKGDLLDPEKEDVERLFSQLSSEAQSAVRAADTPQRRAFLVREWIRAAMFSRAVSIPSDEELREFYANELDTREREELENLSPDEMKEELRRKYFRHQAERSGWRHRRSPGPPRGRRGSGPGPRSDRDHERDRDRDGDGDHDRNRRRGPEREDQPDDNRSERPQP